MFGCRIVTIAGSVIAAVSIAITSFATSVDVLLIVYGVLPGIKYFLICFLLLASFVGVCELPMVPSYISRTANYQPIGSLIHFQYYHFYHLSGCHRGAFS